MSGILNSLVSARSAAVTRSASIPVSIARAISETHVNLGPGAPGGHGGGAGGGGGGLSNAGGADSSGPEHDLSDLRVPEAIRSWLTPLLARFGIRLTEITLPNAVAGPSRLHLALNGSWKAYVLHFPHEVLEDVRYAHPVQTLNYGFTAGDSLRILSTGCQAPLDAYELVWSALANFKIDTVYINWPDVERLQRQAQDPARADTLLPRYFRLPESVKPVSGPMAPQSLLEHQADFAAVTGVIARIGPLRNLPVKAFIEDLMSQAAVPVALRQQGREWPGDFEIAARQLVAYLHDVGAGPAGTGYLYLTRVMVAVMRSELAGEEERRSVLAVFERYRLIPDAELAVLRKELLPGGGP